MSDLEYIEQGYRVIMDESPGLNWEPIADGIALGSHRALIIRQDGERAGFLVYSIQDCGKGEKDFFLTGMYSEQPINNWPLIVSQVKELAVNMGCIRLRFKTTRPGWIKRLRPYGFERTPYFELACNLNGEQP